jgi:hypothetical protein
VSGNSKPHTLCACPTNDVIHECAAIAEMLLKNKSFGLMQTACKSWENTDMYAVEFFKAKYV